MILLWVVFANLSTLDSIEANVESASVDVEQGTEQLRQAREYQAS